MPSVLTPIRYVVFFLLVCLGICDPTYAAFSTSDLSGTWYHLDGMPGDGTPFVYGSISFNASGTLTGGTWNERGIGYTEGGTYTSGSFSVNSEGGMTGQMTSNLGEVFTLLSGQISQEKDLIIFTAQSNSGYLWAGVCVKKGGTGFSAADLQGTWKGQGTNSYWTLALNSLGAVVGGSSTSIGRGTVNLTGGTLSLTGGGAISGSISDPSDSFLIESGQMNLGKTLFGFSGFFAAESSNYGGYIGIKQSGSFATSDLAGTYRLVGLTGESILYGSLTISTGGTITACNGTEKYAGHTDSGTCSGTLTIDSSGGVGGTLVTTSSNSTVLAGQMNSAKTLLTMVGQDAGGSRGYLILTKLTPPSLPTVTVTAPTSSIPEQGPGSGSFEICRNAADPTTLSVYYAWGGTATAGTDFTAELTNPVIIPAHERCVAFPVLPVNDQYCESNETVTMTLSANAAYTLGSPNSATVTILDDDCGSDSQLSNNTLLSDSIACQSQQGCWKYYYADLPSGATNFGIALTNLSGDVDLYVRKGEKPTLAAFSCRSWNSGTTPENCVPEPSSGRWWVGVNNWDIGTISYAVSASWGIPDVPGTIQLSASSYQVNENGGTVTITATRTGGSNGAVGITCNTSNGTASAGADYTAVTNHTLSWDNGDTAGKTFTVSITNDALVEGNETFTVTLSNPTGGATLGNQASAVVTIVDSLSDSSLSLSQGWSLISLPLTPPNPAIGTVLNGISGNYSMVWAYASGQWTFYDPADPEGSTLTAMTSGKGYWIRMNSPGTLALSGTPPPSSITLQEGWNLTGYTPSSPKSAATVLSSISGKYAMVWAYANGQWTFYDPADPEGSTLLTFSPGYAYWIRIKQGQGQVEWVQ